MLFCGIFITCVSTTPATEVSIIPADQTVGEENELLPTNPFTINVTVTDVTDLYAWSVKIYFNNTILNRTSVWLPEDHVFSYTDMNIFTVSPQPGDPDWGEGFITVANTLIGSESRFSGSGTLCQINFTGMASGASDFTIETPPSSWTFLWNFDFEDIPFEVADGSVTVEGVFFKSEISVDAAPTTTAVGSNVTIGGTVTLFPDAVTGEVNVTIQRRLAGLLIWSTIANVTTNSEGQYTGSWIPTRAGDFEIRAIWTGKDPYPGDDSDIVVVTVTEKEEAVDITLYIVIALAVIIVLAIAIYFVKFRKATEE